MLTGRSAVVSAIANEAVEVYRLCATRLRRLLNECPLVSEMLLNAFLLRRKLLEETGFLGVRLVGNSNTHESSRLREFFYKNHVPHTFFDATSPEGLEQLSELNATNQPLPVVHCNGHTVSNPSLTRVAECIGISRDVGGRLFDLLIVGAGPAGLSAAVYASSEGINTLVVDSVGPGGQAGSSSMIENFIGFPSGISGNELANRGYLQALKFGTQFSAPINVEAVEQDMSGEHHLKLCTGQIARARCVLVATGVTYRQLDVPGCQRLEGAGVYYAATTVEARVCEYSTAVVVGGGNSAGQAAMFLAQNAESVKIVIRGDDLSKSMSAYLSKRVLNHPTIELITNSEIVCIHGRDHVEAVDIQNMKSGEIKTLRCAGMFTFIGASPNTQWLPTAVQLDEKGFVLTGSAIPISPEGIASNWPLERSPCDLETTVPGILAAGDVRAGTTKRCAFAVGDGALAVTCVHRYLNDLSTLHGK
jgi:thioredoxin reductase (NADPH)